MTTIERIIDLLNQRGIEQAQFANDLGITKQMVSEWKSGKTKSYRKYIDQIAEYFGVSTDYLLGKTDNAAPSSAQVTDDDIKFALFGGDGEVTDEMYDEVKEFAKFVKSKHKKG